MKRCLTQPFPTIGAIIEHDGKFLLVRESDMKFEGGKWNQPGGWLEHSENPLEAIKREVLEETGYKFEPNGLLGIYSIVKEYLKNKNGEFPHAIKLIFTGKLDTSIQMPLAKDISEIKWFSPEEIFALDRTTLRDIDTKQEIKDFLAGKKFPLDIFTHTFDQE